MRQYLDDDKIPEFSGRKCTCAEYGGCLKSNVDPWKNCLGAEPRGIYEKNERKLEVERATDKWVISEKMDLDAMLAKANGTAEAAQEANNGNQ